MIDQIISQINTLNPLTFNIIVVVISLAMVIKSSDLVVYSISDYARKLGISDYLIGFLVLSIGTSLTELVAAITGATANQGGIVFGAVLGSSLFKFPILGLLLLISFNIKMKESIVSTSPISTLFVIVFPLILLLDGQISRSEGVLLIGTFFLYIVRLWRVEGELGKMKEDVKFKTIWKDVLIFSIALGVLLFSARQLVFSSISISQLLNISPYIVGLVIIGIGASAPEFTVQFKSIRKHRQNIAFGNVLGSLVANSVFVLGVAAVVRPIFIQSSAILMTSLFLIVGVIYTLVLMGKKNVNWKHGLVLVLVYLAFILFELVI